LGFISLADKKRLETKFEYIVSWLVFYRRVGTYLLVFVGALKAAPVFRATILCVHLFSEIERYINLSSIAKANYKRYQAT
jgi:hypothetical protein